MIPNRFIQPAKHRMHHDGKVSFVYESFHYISEFQIQSGTECRLVQRNFESRKWISGHIDIKIIRNE